MKISNRGEVVGSASTASGVDHAYLYREGTMADLGTLGGHSSIANAINATLYKNLTFDVLRDFSPVILAARAPNLLVVNPSVPAKSVQELIALAKARPGKLTVGSSGIGTSPQMTAVLFRHRAGINVVDVPFKGGPEATSAAAPVATSE